MSMLGLNSASIDPTQTIWFWTIFSSALFWRQEEQIAVCSLTVKPGWKYLQPRGLELDLFLPLPHWCHFMLWFGPVIHIFVEGTAVGCFCAETAGLIGGLRTASFSLTLYSSRVTNGAARFHSLRGRAITHVGPQTLILRFSKVTGALTQGAGWEVSEGYICHR